MLELSQLPPSWRALLGAEFDLPYMRQLADFLAAEQSAAKIIFPPKEKIFQAFEYTALDQVKVVVLGQDPYHGPNQAHGLSFSVPTNIDIPPSLRNIYKELETSFNTNPPHHGNLSHWAEQGVLLLNSVLTVESGKAGSHQGKGWEAFTDKVIELINSQCENVVFLLWGAYAHKKGACIDASKHCVLKAPHPSPLSAYRGFFGCEHFLKANTYLRDNGHRPISWL